MNRPSFARTLWGLMLAVVAVGGGVGCSHDDNASAPPPKMLNPSGQASNVSPQEQKMGEAAAAAGQRANAQADAMAKARQEAMAKAGAKGP